MSSEPTEPKPKRKKLEARLRIILLLKKIRSGPQTPDSLAMELDTSRRTIFRDLQVLRQEGIINDFDKAKQAYVLNHDFFLQAVHLTLSEALALHKLCQEASEHDQDFSFCSAARNAGLKISQILPPITRNHIRAMEQLLKYHNIPKHRLGNKSYFFDTLLQSLHRREMISVSYKSPVEPNVFQTILSVYHIFFSRRAWYLLAYSSLHHEVRTFHIGRILELEKMKEHYEIPKHFSHDRYFRNAWHMIPEPGEDAKVVLKFSPKVAQNVAEVLWHKTQKNAFLPDGSLEFQVTVSGLNEISWWILGYGAEVEVISPPELRRLIRNTVKRLCQIYAVSE